MTAFPGVRFAAFAALAVGLALVGLAIPRVASGLLLAGGDDVPAALGRGEHPSQARLAAAVARHRAALDWFESPEIRTDLAALELARAADPATPADVRRAFLDAAIRDYRAGLARGPARPYAWTQYAGAVLARDGADAPLDSLLDMSVATGRYEPPLVLRRIVIGFRAGDALDQTVRRAVRDQLRIAAAAAPGALAAFARAHFALGWVRENLAGEPRLLRRFETAYFGLPLR